MWAIFLDQGDSCNMVNPYLWAFSRYLEVINMGENSVITILGIILPHPDISIKV